MPESTFDDFQDFGGVAVEPQWQLQSRDVRVSCKLLHLIAHSSGPLLTEVEPTRNAPNISEHGWAGEERGDAGVLQPSE